MKKRKIKVDPNKSMHLFLNRPIALSIKEMKKERKAIKRLLNIFMGV